MSFYSYKNANAECSPGIVSGNICQGLNEKICIQVKNVYDSCLQQEQLDDKEITICDIIPVLPDPCNCNCFSGSGSHRCNCSGCTCTCNSTGNCGALTYEEALENAENTCAPLPQPQGPWTFDSCRSSTTCGNITDLTIDRLCDRPQFARIKGNVHIPIDVLFHDACCQEWMGRANLCVTKDVLLAIPDESIVPFTLESMVSAICVSGTYKGDCKFEITICVTIVLKVLAEVELMVPSYGFCQIPPCEEFAENVCDEFFSLPLFPQQTCPTTRTGTCCNNGCNNNCNCSTNTCSGCGMTCGSHSSMCPRCGRAMSCNC